MQTSYQQSILELIQLFEKKITLLNEIGKWFYKLELATGGCL